MDLTNAQKVTLAAALRAETDAGVIQALAIGDDVSIAAWCNSASATDAWATLKGLTLFQLTDVTKFDGITGGKRDAWRLMLDFSPIDFGVALMRQAVQDVWGNANSVAVLQGCRRKATRAEVYLGGTPATQNTVTATVLSVAGTISVAEVGQVLNPGRT